jgi:hypothetical protein
MSIYVTEKENLIGISPVYIQSKYGTLEKTKLFIEKKEMNVESVLYWRKNPKAFCNFSSFKTITRHQDQAPSTARLASRSESTNQMRSVSNDMLNEPSSTAQDPMKLAFHFNNDIKLLIDFSHTKPKVRKTHQLNSTSSNSDFARPNTPRPPDSSFYFSNRSGSRQRESLENKLSSSKSGSPAPPAISNEEPNANSKDDDHLIPGGSDTTSDSGHENTKREGKEGEDDENDYFHETSFEELEKEMGEYEEEVSPEKEAELKAKSSSLDSMNAEDEIFTHLIFSPEELIELFQNFHQKSLKINQLDVSSNHQASNQHQQQQQQQLQRTEIIIRQEQLLELKNHLKTQESMIVLNNFFNRFFFRLLSKGFFQWVEKTRLIHDSDMVRDRHRWRLHAAANQELDLQAWYHALFYQEVRLCFVFLFRFLFFCLLLFLLQFQQVYRLRGHFWYKDAVLPAYKQSYDLVDNALTPLEEAALAHVLCSPDTSYGDVAGQMFIVQAILSPKLFLLFQQLASQGAQIIKYPRQGRPAKKLFRFSFVDGNIYLTWKGKFGNQGVGMYEVTGISAGLTTDVLKWAGQSAKSNLYLSLLCADRSIDLLFDTEQERIDWQELLTALMSKEHGMLPGVETMDPPRATATDFDHLVLFSSIGKKIPDEILASRK